jgi:hypothetical protein
MNTLFAPDGNKQKEVATRAAGGKTRVFHGLNIILNRPISKIKGQKQATATPGNILRYLFLILRLLFTGA